MTSEQLDTAAMDLCRIRQIDPDQLWGHADADHPTLLRYSPAWKIARGEIEAFAQVLQAIAGVSNGELRLPLGRGDAPSYLMDGGSDG